MSRQDHRRSVKVFVGVALGAAATALAALFCQTTFVRSVEDKSYDLRVVQTAVPADAASPVVIVEINESSVRGLEPVVGRWPWPRLVHASAVDYLKRSGAKVIAYDVLFGEHEGRSESVINGRAIAGDESDRAFVNSVQQAGNIVLLADAIYEGRASGSGRVQETVSLPGIAYRPGPGFQTRPIVTPPFSELAAGAVALGHNYLAKDPNSDFARRMLPFVESQGAYVPSLGIAAVLAFQGLKPADVELDGNSLRLGPARVPLLSDPVVSDDVPQPSRQALVRFSQPVSGKDGVKSIFPTYSFFDVVLSEDNVQSGRVPVIPPSAFENKVVFIGTTAPGLYDRYSTPFPGGAAGVELHATLADNILSQRFMQRASLGVDAAYAAAAGLAAGLAATLLPVGIATGATLAVVGAVLYWLTLQVGHGVWVSATMPTSAAGLALFGGVAWRYFVEDREKRHVRQLFGRYVSHEVIEQLMSDPSLVSLGGQRREMTVLFSDIRGFTSASERATPEAVVAQLNEYFGAMVEVLFRHQGTLDKFVGDMVMGLFGAPLSDARHADHAVGAALEMIRTLDRLNDKWHREGKPQLAIGIGINSGEMIAGNIGSEAIMSYTVIGDAVNLGSRLESLNKEYGTHILVSDATRSRLTIDVDTRSIGAVTVKGRTQPVEVFEVRDRTSISETEHER